MFKILVFERKNLIPFGDLDGTDSNGVLCVDKVECETSNEVCDIMNLFCTGKPADKWSTENYIHIIYENDKCIYTDAIH